MRWGAFAPVLGALALMACAAEESSRPMVPATDIDTVTPEPRVDSATTIMTPPRTSAPTTAALSPTSSSVPLATTAPTVGEIEPVARGDEGTPVERVQEQLAKRLTNDWKAWSFLKMKRTSFYS